MKKSNKQKQEGQQVPPALQVFSKNRDLDSDNPYHLDGNMDMYTDHKLKQREQLSKDQDIRQEIQKIVNLYETDENGNIAQDQYKRMQRKMALALRSDIEEDQLEFIVDQDWQLDSTDGRITKDVMIQKIFEVVDVWTIGVQKSQYISFIRLLSKKIGKKNKNKA